MLGIGEDTGGYARLADGALFHHHNIIGAVTRHGQIMGNKKDAHGELFAHFIKEIQDDFLHGDIQRGSRLIGDDELWLQCHSGSDEHALLHAAGKLMRVLMITALWIINAHALQQLQSTLLPGLLIVLPVDGHALFHRGSDGLERIERVIGILRNQPDASATQGAPLLLGEMGDIVAVESNGAGDNRGIVWQQANGGHGGGGLAGAGLAHDGGHFPGVHFELNAADRFHLAVGGAVRNG